MTNKEVFLPGLNNQISFLQHNLKLDNFNILVIGAFSENIALNLTGITKNTVQLIIPDFDSLLNANMVLEGNTAVKVKIMDYENTDFDSGTFDLVYAQASISTENRRKILKEIKRILKPDGYLCVGEITTNTKNLPVFLIDAFYNSGLSPIFYDDMINFYKEVGFLFFNSEDMSDTLPRYYAECKRKLGESKSMLKENEKSYHKKILKRISHESNLFTKFHADKYIGFSSLLFKRG